MATTPKVTLHPDAYTVLFLHCCKHPHRALNGLLLGSATSDSVTVTEALPLFHSSLALAPMLEAALLLVRTLARPIAPPAHRCEWSSSCKINHAAARLAG